MFPILCPSICLQESAATARRTAADFAAAGAVAHSWLRLAFWSVCLGLCFKFLQVLVAVGCADTVDMLAVYLCFGPAPHLGHRFDGKLAGKTRDQSEINTFF